MLAASFKYTDTEIKKLLASIIILVDTREQVNNHITDYFNSKKIVFKSQKMDTGDYGIMLPSNPELGIMRDMYFPVVVERKNSIDEVASNIKEDRFENELIRSQSSNFLLLIEDSYKNLITGNYRSQYAAKTLLARIKTFESRYKFTTVFMDKSLTGNYIFHHLFYQAREILKSY